MQLGGGWGQILHERVTPTILLEVQKLVQLRLEKKWLPLFLTNEDVGLQKKIKVMFQQLMWWCSENGGSWFALGTPSGVVRMFQASLNRKNT